MKNDGVQQGSDIANEFKTLIGDFKSDINPNIEKLKSHIENLQNRGEELVIHFQKIRIITNRTLTLSSIWL